MTTSGAPDVARRWLLRALVLDLAVYATSRTDYPSGQTAVPWLLLDLFLFRRIGKGSSGARFALLVLNSLGVVLGGLAVVAEATTDSVGGPGWLALLLLTACTACLLHPSLTTLQAAGRARTARKDRGPTRV